jgi:NAD(P)-dependent dehydrogenase (short-subunit alcohol dehydrogenase family)
MPRMTDVLITGASRGIGYALTRAYLARGARVFAVVRDPDRAPAVRALAADPAAGDRIVIVPLDVTSTSDIPAAVAAVAAYTDGLDLLINNAGGGSVSTGLAGVDAARMLDAFRLNTIAPVLITQRFLGLLRPAGRLVNMTMPSRPIGALSRSGDLAFVASRYALNVMTRMIANELGDDGPIVVALWPGYLRTDLNGNTAEATPLDEAIPGLVDLIERLGPADHGTCLRPDGSRVDW